MMFLNIVFEVMLAEGNFQSFPFNDYKNSCCNFFLKSQQQCLLVQELCPGLVLS